MRVEVERTIQLAIIQCPKNFNELSFTTQARAQQLDLTNHTKEELNTMNVATAHEEDTVVVPRSETTAHEQDIVLQGTGENGTAAVAGTEGCGTKVVEVLVVGEGKMVMGQVTEPVVGRGVVVLRKAAAGVGI